MEHILITGKLAPIALEILEREPTFKIDYRPDLPMGEILEIVHEYDCLISRSETPVERELIDKASRLRVIARAAVGVGNIDIEYATERGILVLNTPGMNTNSAAELTFGLLIAAFRKIVPAHQTMQNQGWDRHRFTGHELRGKTIGIIGLGNVGHRVARFAHGFDMHVLAYDPYIAPAIFERHQAEKVDLETLCRRSDIITVHVPKTRETSGMLGARELAWMKDGVVLLNAARGGIIQEPVLLEGLKSGKVAAAGVDTWEVEPPKGNPFRELSNIIMTPHIGASTTEAQHAIGLTVAQQVVRALKGEVVDFPVNMPQMKILEGSPAKQYTVLSEKLGLFAAQFIDFTPTRLEIFYRGGMTPDDVALIKLSFLKGFLQHTSEELVTHVNAERKAMARGIEVVPAAEAAYSDYESSIRFVLSDGSMTMQVAGVVFSGGHMRFTLINDHMFEMEPKGTLLVTTNQDRPGMIGVIGTVLGSRSINIDQFELARNRPGGEAMALIRIDDDAPDSVLEQLRVWPGITSVKRIRL